MAAEGRGTRTALERRELEARLAERPFEFDFFEAVRQAEKALRGSSTVGRFANPENECARFAVHNTLEFPASQIQQFEWREGEPPRMTVNFMGLTGPLGILPYTYTELIRERVRAKDTTLRDFFDLFNHRAISLFYAAWEKYRFAIEFERSGRDQLSHHLLDLLGLGTRGLLDRQAVPDNSLVFYTGLIAPRTRSAVALKQLLEDYFEVPVAIEQFAGGWCKLDPGEQGRVDDGAFENQQVSVGAVVGDEVWDQQGRVRIKLGPLTLEQYQDFLPAGTAYQPLRAIAKFYASDEVDFEVQLILKREEVPEIDIGLTDDPTAPRLGWVSWAHTAPMARDPGETVLKL